MRTVRGLPDGTERGQDTAIPDYPKESQNYGVLDA